MSGFTSDKFPFFEPPPLEWPEALGPQPPGSRVTVLSTPPQHDSSWAALVTETNHLTLDGEQAMKHPVPMVPCPPHDNQVLHLAAVRWERKDLTRAYDVPGYWTCSFSSQPVLPETNDGTPIVDLVRKDLEDRAEAGKAKYGTYLQAHNGRKALVDAYQEALDLCMYLRQAIEEQRSASDE